MTNTGVGETLLFMNLTLDGVMQAPGRPDEDFVVVLPTVAGRRPTGCHAE